MCSIDPMFSQKKSKPRIDKTFQKPLPDPKTAVTLKTSLKTSLEGPSVMIRIGPLDPMTHGKSMIFRMSK